MNPRRVSWSGFSLIEMIIAIAVIAFSVSVIMTLLPLALHSLKDSSNTTVVAAMADSTFSSLKSQNFYTPTATTYLPATTDVAPGNTIPAITNIIYFDGSGTRLYSGTNDLTSTAQAVAAGGVYQCIMVQAGDSATRGAFGSNGYSTTTQEINQLNVKLTFIWPLQAAGQSSPVNSKIFNASFSR